MTTSYQNYWNKKKRKQAKINGAMFAITFIAFISGLVYLSQFKPEVYVRETGLTIEDEHRIWKENKQLEKELEESLTDEDIIYLIKQHFPRNGEIMVAIAKAESRLKINAVGYNCYYNADETIVYETRVKGSHSRHCKKGHEKYAWSVDCNILQKNYPGRKTCPYVPVEKHLEEVAKLSRVQGLQAWSSYNNNSYKQFLVIK